MSSPVGATTPIFDALVTEIGLRWPDWGPGDTRPRGEAKHQAAKPVLGNSRPGARRDDVDQNGDLADLDVPDGGKQGDCSVASEPVETTRPRSTPRDTEIEPAPTDEIVNAGTPAPAPGIELR
jgi:hypothetical protein